MWLNTRMSRLVDVQTFKLRDGTSSLTNLAAVTTWLFSWILPTQVKLRLPWSTIYFIYSIARISMVTCSAAEDWWHKRQKCLHGYP